YREWLTNLKILDPACGSGAFLNQALEFLINEHTLVRDMLLPFEDLTLGYEIEKEILEHNLYGVDINEDAVEIAKLSLWLRTAHKGRELTKLADKIKCGNSLIDDKTVAENAFVWEEEFAEVFVQGGFDVVIGNPPYVDSESMTKFYKDERKWIAKKYKTAVGNWDIFIPFVELGLSLLKNSRYLSFIIPNKILSANYGTTLREYINENYSLNEIFDLSVNNVFEIDVYPVIVSLNKETQVSNIKISYQKDEEVFSRNVNYRYENNWALYLDRNYDLYSKVFTKYKLLNLQKEFSLYSSASVSEAYEIKEFIENSKIIDTDYLKLINTGTIDPYSCSWGISSMTYIKDTYMHPIINLKNIKKKMWTQKPKIAFAGMATRIEAFIDTEGVFLPLKSTTVLTAESESSLKFIGCILNSRLITFIFKIANSANTMAGGYLNINQDNLGMLPIPNILLENQQPFIQKANKMLALYKQLQETKQNFTNELGLEKLTKKLQNFEELEFDEFIKEYAKAKKLKFADKLAERNFKQEWQAIFENDKAITCKLKDEIAKTDKEIDEMVYKLYDLTDDEIKIVEGV
ncbi:MAG: DNA methyltransferase, partial [Sulfurimonas sp.]|uniref:Eco57I restriction-modification methylase domain-containing protein n=1 Tax=Sulfurimonas sp. TaxID=2022749 RepID=UPI0028CFB8FA